MSELRQCDGGPGADRDAYQMTAACPGCGTVFSTMADEPVFPPHVLNGSTVMFFPTPGGE